MGLWHQLRLHSRTSQYGQQITSRKFLDMDAMRDSLRKVVKHIQSGKFVREWQEEQDKGIPNLISETNENLKHPMQEAENRLYRMLGRRKSDITTATWLTGEEDDWEWE
jgi:ketol-acid reductoisomerase